MKKEEIQNLKDKAFQARNEAEWNDVMQAIKAAVAADENAANVMRTYCKSLLPKKKAYWAAYPQKSQFQAKPKMMFSADTDEAIAAMCDAIRVYYSNLCVIQAAEHPELNLNINNNTN